MTGVMMVAVVARILCSAAPTPAEMDEARQWVSAKFDGVAAAAAPGACIEVLANNDAVQPNARGGKPMRIGDRTFTRGLYCHAVSKLIVHLPGPAKAFEAIAGVDSNDQTAGGRGSVVFSVAAKDKELWSSGVMHEGMPGIAVSLELGGAMDIVLNVSDARDGISCDQADWADARVTLADGSVIWLGDMPLNQVVKRPYTIEPFFAFNYGGKASSEFLASWKLERASKKLDDSRVEHTLTYTDPETGLVIRCVGVEYLDFPTIEWTLYFKNSGAKDTPILSDIMAIDTRFERASAEEFTLFRNKGDNCTPDSFEPVTDKLAAKSVKHLANTGGRPTQTEWPYVNIAMGHEGVIFVLSWAGQWATQYSRDESNGLRVCGGQELTHFKLLPGEEVRTPMIVLQFYKGEPVRAQNVWRAWMLAHNLPRPGGKLPPVPELAACSSHQFGEMIHANMENQEFFIDKYLERGIKLDYWWMDAGWYWNKSGWPNTGTWEVDTDRFPGGLRVISDHAHAKDVNTIVWFEPERVTGGTWLTENHPEWIHGGKDGGLLDLGNPEACKWLTDHINTMITEQGIDLYRQDFNIDPLDFWRKSDAEDRQGITEIRHVEGYFAYWDGLRKEHPNMLIDSCASGGRRNDLETLRRAAPLLRSDYIMEPVGNQCHTYALSSWFPFYGTGTSRTEPYMIRSTLCPHFTACWDQRDDKIDFPAIKRIMDQWKESAPNYFGDYYPLTAYTLANDQWIGWQFDRPEAGQGMVQVFRRDASPYESARIPLSAVDPEARYRVTNVDDPGSALEISGKDLREKGLLVTIPEKPSSAFFVYAKLM